MAYMRGVADGRAEGGEDFHFLGRVIWQTLVMSFVDGVAAPCFPDDFSISAVLFFPFCQKLLECFRCNTLRIFCIMDQNNASLRARMGTTKSAVSRLEASLRSPTHSPSFATLRKYAHACGKRLVVTMV